MKKILNLLFQAGESLSGLVMSAIILVLFFMWFPDFIAWYSVKLVNIEMSFLLEVIPLVIMVSGIAVVTLLILSSAFHLRKPEIKEQV